MASKGVILYGPKGERLQGSTRGAGFGGSDRLYEASQWWNRDRKQIFPLDVDVHRNVSSYGRRQMLTLGRWVYSNFPAVRGAVNEMAEYSSAVFMPQYYGENVQWGERAEAWMENHDKVCDVAGWPFTHRHYRRNLITSVLRDGDMLTVKMKRDGYPMLQCIPGHRISSCDSDVAEGKEWDGARIIDGVILDDYGAPLGYRVLVDEKTPDGKDYVDIPRRDAFLSFIPDYVGQVRGFSRIGMAVHHWQDIAEGDRLHMIRRKLAASIGLIERNEEGEAPPGDAEGYPVTSGGAGLPATERVMTDGVTLRYFRSSDPDAGLEILKNDTPSANEQQFRHDMVRDAFAGLDWSIDFALDPTKAGGAEMRVVVEKVNRSIEALQDMILEPACASFNGFRLGCAMQLGVLPRVTNWWHFQFQRGAKITADAKYQSELDIAEVSNGLKTRKQAIANRGSYIDDVDREIELDADRKWAAAKRISDKFKVPIESAYNSMWSEQPNGIPPEQPEKTGGASATGTKTER